MTITYKRWTGLGLTALLVAGCGDTEPTAAEKTAEDQPTAVEGEAGEAADGGEAKVAAVADAGEAGEGEGGEGEAGEGGEGGEGGEAGEAGEGGEGGIAIDQATTDPVVYKSGLAIVEAHIIAARDAYALGKTDAAAEMFAHPVAEVLVDMEPVFEALDVSPFDQLLLEASEAAANGVSQEEINEYADLILVQLLVAAKRAPASDMPAGTVEAAVAADQIERAVEQYRFAAADESYEPYLDGYGFYKTAAAIRGRSETEINADNARAGEAIDAALSLLAAAYPTAERPASLDADQGALLGASSQLKLALSN